MITAIVFSAAAVLIYMTAWFLVSLARKDNSLADVAWGGSFILVAGLTLFRRGVLLPRPLLVSGLVLVWGLRLAFHIARRNRRRGEDPRYAAWRRSWGRWFVLRSYVQIFILQGVFLLVVASPILVVNAKSGAGLRALDFAGAAIWLFGFIFESVADAELSRFKRDPGSKGKIMTWGLWRYSRHPNYFGEAAMWWGIYVIALSVSGGWAAIFGPVLITVLLTRVSGIPLLEKRYAGNPEFEAYAGRTSAFVPWFPKIEKGRPRGTSP